MSEEQKKWKEYNEKFKQRIKDLNNLYSRMSMKERIEFNKRILEDYPVDHIERKKYGL